MIEVMPVSKNAYTKPFSSISTDVILPAGDPSLAMFSGAKASDLWVKPSFVPGRPRLISIGPPSAVTITDPVAGSYAKAPAGLLGPGTTVAKVPPKACVSSKVTTYSPTKLPPLAESVISIVHSFEDPVAGATGMVGVKVNVRLSDRPRLS